MEEKKTDCFDEKLINIKELLYESDYRQSLINSEQFMNYTNDYNTYDNDNINGMSTYNALRYLYRTTYDLRSKGYTNIYNDPNKIEGLENHPISGEPMKINYFNDFSISSKFNAHESNDFADNICNMTSMSLFPFLNEDGKYKNSYNERLSNFINSDSTNKNGRSYTTDFFSYNMQVNPLLYTYRVMDENKRAHIMDSDYFLKLRLYDVFKNQSHLMKGNQSSIKLWQIVTNIDYKRNNIEDDEGNVIDTELIFDHNNKLLFKDDYTNNFMYILQNPSEYFKFIKQNDHIINDKAKLKEEDILNQSKNINDVVNEENSRGHLFYDTLFDIVIKRTKEVILNDNESNNEDKESIQKLEFILKNTYTRNRSEFDLFPIDTYITNDSYYMNSSTIQNTTNDFKKNLGAKVLGTYRYQYNLVFGQYFRLLPYVLSPLYRYKLQSPSANIMYTTFTLMAIKNAYYNDKENYNKIFNKLYESVMNMNDFNIDKLNDEYIRIFDNGDTLKFLSNNICDHLMNILPLLIQNTTAINFNGENEKDLDEMYSNLHYHVETDISKMEFIEDNVNEDDKKKILIDRALILLTEFFYKADKIKFFDASTFCIDYTLINDKNKKSLKLFSDALMEACYIHMNILGTESFFNGKVSGHSYIGNIYNISKDLFDTDYIEFDTTRVAKCNNKLFEESKKVNNNYKNNSFNSYLSVINIYISLCNCINITLDNLSNNIYNAGPYTHENIRRSQSPWAIFKRYAIHMTYINNNSYGIYNDVKIGNNDKNTIEKVMVSQRIKWLTYGLHLRVWFNDAYFFYTNYKKCMINFNGNLKKAVNYIIGLYNTHSNGITQPLTLFNDINPNIILPLPNIGLATAPMMGSYGIDVNFLCMFKLLRKSAKATDSLISLINHGFKDIMVGDSMCSILDERRISTYGLLNNSQLSYNNINGNLQKVYDEMNMSYFYEVSIAYNLNYLYKKYIKKYFIENPKFCVLLNSAGGHSYDEQFFKNQKIIDDFIYTYDCSWCSELFNSRIFNDRPNEYMRFINRVITLHRIYVENYYNLNSNNRSILSQFSDKYYGLSLMNSQFINKYKKGIKLLIRNKKKYAVLQEIVRGMFRGNYNDDTIKIANALVINNCCMGLEDLIANGTFGGTLYAMYESPFMALLYNNLDFDYAIVPTKDNLYTFTKKTIMFIHSFIKKIIVSLDKGIDPIVDDNKQAFINECIHDMNIVNDEYQKNEVIRFREVKEIGDVYKFATSICQFMDYDFIAEQYSKLLDNEYDISNEEDIIRFFNNFRSNRGDDITRFESYCNIIDGIESYFNSTIKNIKESNIISNNINNNPSNNNININGQQVKFGNNSANKKEDIIKFTQQLKANQESRERAKKEFEEFMNKADDVKEETIEAIKEINNNVQNINNNVGDNSNMIVNTLNKMITMLSDKLDLLNKNVYDIKHAFIYSNRVLGEINQGIKELKENSVPIINNENIHEEYIIEKDNNIVNNNENNNIKELTYENIMEAKDEDGIPYVFSLPDNIDRKKLETTEEMKKFEESVTSDLYIMDDVINTKNNDQETINNIERKEDDIEPIEINNDTIIFYNGDNTNELVVKKDLNPSHMEDRFIINNEIIELKEYTVSSERLNEEYNMENIERANYNDYFYVPKSSLLKYIPYCGFKFEKDDVNQLNPIIDASFVNIDLHKANKQAIPLYEVQTEKLIIPFDNIPISFDQKIDYIIEDIEKRISPINKKLADNLVKFIKDNIIMFGDWDNNMKFRNRISTLKIVFMKMKNNKLLSPFWEDK